MKTKINKINNQSLVNNEITDKKKIIYELIFLQISNLIKDLRVVLPNDIVLKVCQDNLRCFNKNKVETINYFKDCLDEKIVSFIRKKDESLFDDNNKSLKNIKFKRSTFVFNKIRRNWELLGKNEKIVVWKYLNFILKLIEQV